MDSSISTLADELLYHIFTMSAWTSVSPWTLAAVCNRWRAICAGSPALWTRFYLFIRHKCEAAYTPDQCATGGSSNPDLDRFQHHFQLSGQALIDVLWTEGSGPCVVKMMHILAGPHHSTRWQTLSLRIGYRSAATWARCFHPLTNPPIFSSLKHLQYSCVQEFNSRFAIGPAFTSTSLPALESLRLEYWAGKMNTGLVGAGRQNMEFPWAQLRHVCLVECTSDWVSLVLLLEACKDNLTHFAVSACDPASPKRELGSDVANGVLLRHLVQLEIDCTGDEDRTPATTQLNIIRYICAPDLHTMAICACDALGGTPVDEDFREMIRRSGCSIRCLDVTESWGDLLLRLSRVGHSPLDPLPSFVHAVSQGLEELTIREANELGTGFTPDATNLLRRMVSGTSHPAGKNAADLLFPRLKILQLCDLHFDPHLLAEVVQTRQEIVRHQGVDLVGFTTNAKLERIEIWHSPSNGGGGGIESELGTFMNSASNSCKVVCDPREFIPRFRLDDSWRYR